MRVGKFSILLFSSLLILGVAACQTGGGDKTWYGNRAALASTLEKPVAGSPDQRTYVNPAYREAKLGFVKVEDAKVKATSSGREITQLAERMVKVYSGAALLAVDESGRTSSDEGPTGKNDATLSIDILVHVSTLDPVVTVDPVTKDPRSKVFVVYTLTDDATGKVILKHTTSQPSHFEYAPMAMEDLERAGSTLAQELLHVLQEF